MCGIAGLMDIRRRTSNAELTATCAAMARALAHRGPDGNGIWVDPNGGIAIGHRRLAIIDLSPTGQQPMVSRDQRFVISYNGEIYNAHELRAELEANGHTFLGHSDTEIVVEGCSAWGVFSCVKRLNGMFAFAVWDLKQRKLTLVRDRLGIKPLYWGRFADLFLFGSELKALRAHPGWAVDIDRDALAGYMRQSYVAAPRSIYRGVQKLEPGKILTLDARGNIKIDCYWDIRAIATTAVRSQTETTVDELEVLLKDAVRRCMIADVPLGAFLSGGLDSSTVVALMQLASTRPVRTFTIGFEDSHYNEAVHAQAVAAHLGTDHTELYVEHRHLLEIVPGISNYFDEPFADPSQIPTCLLAALTRKEVTVALSGDGGDELFGGYARYFQAQRLWAIFGRLPKRVLQFVGSLALRLSASSWDMEAPSIGLRSLRARDRMQKLADFLPDGDSTALYRQIISHCPRPEELVLDAKEPRGTLWDSSIARDLPDLIDQMRLIDFLTYLPDYVLTKVDRASMAVGLEARVPLLDHRVVEFAWSLPTAHIHGNRGKRPLQLVLDRYVPRHLIERPKMGFIPPLGNWLSGPLRSWAEELLNERRLREQGLLNPALVRARWREHLTGQANWCWFLWDVLAFQAWLDGQGSQTLQLHSNAMEHNDLSTTNMTAEAQTQA